MDYATLELRADSREVRTATSDLKQFEKAGGGAEKATTGLAASTKLLSGAIAAVGLSNLAGNLLSTLNQTEKMKGSLQTMTGSVDNASAAFDKLTKFAEKTPFTLDQSVNAFIKLKALGLDPSERALMSYGNTAAAMGKDMMQMIEAVADASTGEFERLKEFGIKAKKEGDNVSLVFQGVTTTIRNDSESIQEYLLNIGETKFGDAMANQMERLPGLLSNLEDSVDGLFRKIGDSGATDAFGSAIKAASGAVQTITEHTDDLAAAIGIASIAVSAKFVPSVVLSAASLKSYFVATETATVATNFLGQRTVTATIAQSGFAASLSATRAALYAMAGPLGIGAVLGGAYLLVQAAKDQAAAIDGVTVALDKQLSTMTELSEVELARSIQKTREHIDALKQRSVELGIVEKAGGRVTDELRRNNLEIAANEDNLGSLVSQLRRVQDGWKKGGESLGQLTESVDDNAGAVEFLNSVYANSAGAIGITADQYLRLMGVSDAVTPKLVANVTDLDAVLNQTGNTIAAVGDTSKVTSDAMQREFESTRDYFADTFVTGMKSGWGGMLESLEDSLKASLMRMAAQIAASGLLKAFGMSGATGTISSVLGGLGGGLGGAIGGGAITATQAAAMNLPAGAAGIGGSVSGALGAVKAGASKLVGAIPGWGWALGGAALIASQLDKSTPSYNAGLLLHDVPGAKADQKFAVAPFDSGLAPVGFARRSDQGAANQVIDVFRQDDAVLTALSRAAGIDVRLNANSFRGLDERGLGSGVFLGAAGEEGKPGQSVEQQRTQFVKDWVSALPIGSNAKAKLLSAGSADDIINKAGELVAGLDGSHRDGLDYVPYDGYRAELHAGEQVKSVSQQSQESGMMAKMLESLDYMARELSEIKISNRQIRDINDKWDGIGLPATQL